ncbi:13358_t:CDS:2, partial [Racocetra persica]
KIIAAEKAIVKDFPEPVREKLTCRKAKKRVALAQTSVPKSCQTSVPKSCQTSVPICGGGLTQTIFSELRS